MQVNQNVNAANFMQVGNLANAADRIAKSESAGTGKDFASFLEPAAAKKEQEVSTFGAEMKDTDGRNTVSKTVSEVSPAKQPEKDGQPVDTVKKPAQADMASETPAEEMPEEDVTEAVIVTEKEMESVLEAVSQILQVVMNQFDLTAEELTQQLESFGMEMEDLLAADGQQLFFLNMHDAEPADLLINEDLNTQFGSFMQEMTKVQEIAEDLDIPLETVENILQNTDMETVLTKVADAPSALAKEEPVVLDVPDDAGDSAAESVQRAKPEVTVKDNRQAQSENKQDAFSESGDAVDDAAVFKTLKSGRNETKNTFENPILQAINDSVNAVTETAMQEETPVSASRIVEQIVERVKVEMNQNSSSLEMQLYPEHLGRIQIQVISKDGVMTARIAAETEAAKQAIENGLSNLREAMEQQDLKVEAVEVMVSTTGFGQSEAEQHMNEQQKSKRTNRDLDLSGSEEELPEETAEIEKMRAAGSSVSYTA